MNNLQTYWSMIQSGEVIVGKYLKKEIRNLIRDLDDPSYIYDTRESDKRIKFMETFCLQGKQPYFGKPLVLLPWQKAFWEALYSFRMADTGRKRFTEALLLVARKNGKSTMLAADAMADLFCGAGGMDICCASNDDKQAKIIWEEVKGMRQRLDPRKAVSSDNITLVKNDLKNNRVMRLSAKSKSKDGLNLSVTFLDESHDICEDNGQSEIAEACWRAMSSKDEPLFINSTTQGFNRECYLDLKIRYCKAVIDGEIDDIHILPFLYEPDSEQEIWQDPKSWEKANPSLRYGVKKLSMMEQYANRAKFDKASRIHFLTKDCNIPQSSGQSWLLLEDYAYPTEPVDLEQFRGGYYLGAVDLSATTDLSNAKLLIMKPGDNKKYVVSRYYIPESKLENSDDKSAGAEYLNWARNGWVEIHEGNEIDISQIADWYFSLFMLYELKPLRLGYDQRYAKPFLDRAADYGMETEMLAQGRYLSNAMNLTERDLKARVIQGLNPVDLWCLGNTCCSMDNFGNIQPTKIPGINEKRIDGGVTLIMLEEVYRRYRADYLKVIGGA